LLLRALFPTLDLILTFTRAAYIDVHTPCRVCQRQRATDYKAPALKGDGPNPQQKALRAP